MRRTQAASGLLSAAGLLAGWCGDAANLAAQDHPIELFAPETLDAPLPSLHTVSANVSLNPTVPVASAQRVFLPLPQAPRDVNGSSTNEESVSLVIRDAALADVLTMIAGQHGLKLEHKPELGEHVTISLYDVPLQEALEILLQPRGYVWSRDAEQLTVMAKPEEVAPPAPQPIVRVFSLAWLTRSEVEPVVTELLSSTGKSRYTAVPAGDAQRPRTEVVIIDEQPAIERIERYLTAADIAPPHVLVDVRVLQVPLSGGTWQGINLLPLAAELGGQPLGESSRLVRCGDRSLETVVQSIQSHWSAQAVANPQLLVVNGERAGVQTAGLNAAAGVTLQVTPRVAGDGRIALTVRPELSDGQIDPATGQVTTDASINTTLLVNDGETLVIAGLIQQHDVQVWTKRRVLGDLPLIGSRFQQHYVVPNRTEMVLVLAPRIVRDAVAPTVAQLLE